MKTTYTRGRKAHSSYLADSFQTTVLFLVFITITALAFTSCGNQPGVSKKVNDKKLTQHSQNTKYTTAIRSTCPVVVSVK